MLKDYVRQYYQIYNAFVDGRITQYMHQVASGNV